MLNAIKNISAVCNCGQKHKLDTKMTVISDDASLRLCDFVGENYKQPLIVCDSNTEKYVHLLTVNLRNSEVIVLAGDSHADEAGIAPLDDKLKAGKYDCIIACGSGSLHDITRYTSNAHNIPFVSYPTAASVDGFVSTVAAMTFGSRKHSTEASAPVALFADERVFSDAPVKLTASGIGDILGKYTALLDWKVANILTGEALCPEIFGLMERALGELTELLEAKAEGKISPSSPQYANAVMNSLVLAGLAMQLQGNSRPASGSEHHLSHLWEMQVINPATGALHGEQVGVASLMLADFYRKKLDEGSRLILKPNLHATFDRSYIESGYGVLTDSILDENLIGRNPETSTLNFIPTDNSETLVRKEVLKLILPEKLNQYLKIAGAPTSIEEIDLPNNSDFINKSLNFAPYVRRRLTLLKILSSKR
jgi:glycerol-1-phosphate dehydrogenase [NAD(P)+]